MPQLLTEGELEAVLREEVAAAGGAKRWCKKHNLRLDHVLHMITDGRAATLPNVMEVLGYRRVHRFEKIAADKDEKD